MLNIQSSVAATGQSTEVKAARGVLAITLSGTWAGTAAIQRSLDGGSNWHTVVKDSDGNLAEYTANGSFNVAVTQPSEQWRVDFTRTSGTLVVDFDQRSS